MNFYLLPRLQLIVGLTCRKDEQFCYQKFRTIFPLTFFGPQDIHRRSAHTSIVPNFLWATAFSFRRRIRTRQQWIDLTRTLQLLALRERSWRFYACKFAGVTELAKSSSAKTGKLELSIITSSVPPRSETAGTGSIDQTRTPRRTPPPDQAYGPALLSHTVWNASLLHMGHIGAI